jgi:SAM-dependent methyltransferase
MALEIIETPPVHNAWLDGLGLATVGYLLDWERAHADELLADVFGYHALQVGWPLLDSLRASRMPHRWTAKTEFEFTPQGPQASNAVHESLCMDSRAWPWPAESLDLVVLPHTLEQSADPHACLREVERVLIPEGHLFITGINPWSFWGWRQMRFLRQQRQISPEAHLGQLLSHNRLCDWLRLLGFEVQVSHFGGWTPGLQSEHWRKRWSWLERVGHRWWPIWGGAYLIVATKRVRGGHLLTRHTWRKVRSAASSTVPAARTDASVGHHGP